MGKNYCNVHIEHGKGRLGCARAASAAYAHNYRTSKSAAPYADETLMNNNREYVDDNFGIENHDFLKIINKKISESPYYQKHNVRKNAVTYFEATVGFSAEAYTEDFPLDKWAKKNLEWMQERFGKENVISGVLHMDEKKKYRIEDPETGEIAFKEFVRPHMHFIITPFREDGGLDYSTIVGDKFDLIKLQDNYAKSMEEFGLERGEWGQTDRYNYADARKKSNSLAREDMKEVPVPAENETTERYMERMRAFLEKLEYDRYTELLKAERKRKIAEKKQKDVEEGIFYDRRLKEHERHKELKEKLEFVDDIIKIFDIRDDTLPEERKKIRAQARMAVTLTKAIEEYPDYEIINRFNELVDTIMSDYRKRHRNDHERDIELGQNEKNV